MEFSDNIGNIEIGGPNWYCKSVEQGILELRLEGKGDSIGFTNFKLSEIIPLDASANTKAEKILDFDNIMKGLKLVVPKNSKPIDIQGKNIWSGDNGEIEFEILSNNEGASDLFRISPQGKWDPPLELHVPLPEEKCISLGYNPQDCCNGANFIYIKSDGNKGDLQKKTLCNDVTTYSSIIFKLETT